MPDSKPQTTISLPVLTPDQEAYLRQKIENTGKFDPTVVIGGPDAGKRVDPPTTVRGLITGKEYPARANRLGEEIGWIDLTRTCRSGHTETLTVDERHQAIPPHGYCLTCWPINSGRSPAPKWVMQRSAENAG